MSDIQATPPDGLTRLQYLLAMLDAALTGKRWADVLHTARTRKATVDNLLFDGGDTAYYLSDGGYSRVVVRLDYDDNVKMFPTSNSTAKVKANWDNCRELIEDVANEVRKQLEGIK